MNRSVFDNWGLDNFVGVISVGTVSVGISVISSVEGGGRKGVVSIGISLINCCGRISRISFCGRVSSISGRISISDLRNATNEFI